MVNLSDLPTELLTEILFRLDTKTLSKKCVLICKEWETMIQQIEFWRRYHIFHKTDLPDFLFDQSLPWWFFASLEPSNIPFNKNLLTNGSAELVPYEEMDRQSQRIQSQIQPDGSLPEIWDVPWPEYESWNLMGSAGLGWTVELPPTGSDCLRLQVDPDEDDDMNYMELPGHFMISFHSCTKEQIIDLKEKGFSEDILDSRDFSFVLCVNEWYCMTCPGIFELSISCLDENKEQVFEDKSRISQPTACLWRNTMILRTIRLEGVRYLRFYHGGTAQHNVQLPNDNLERLRGLGVKIGGARVMLSYPLANSTLVD